MGIYASTRTVTEIWREKKKILLRPFDPSEGHRRSVRDVRIMMLTRRVNRVILMIV